MKLKTVAFNQEWYDAWMLAFNELKETFVPPVETIQ